MRELGDGLTPEQVTKMIRDASDLLLTKPSTIIDGDGGVERPLPDDERQAIAYAFLEGSVARLSQWWREDEQENVAAAINPLDADALRVALTIAVSHLGEIGWTIAEHPSAPPGVDPRAN